MSLAGEQKGVIEISWDEFQKIFKWKQGDHVTIIGPTESGKTYLAESILPRRSYVAAMITKRKDPMIQKFQRAGYTKLKDWREVPHEIHPRVLLHPPFARDEPRERYQRDCFTYAFDRAFTQGHWCLYADELPYLIDELKMDRWCKRQWNQGRSQKSCLVASAQRPAFLPLLAYSAPPHLFFFNTTDDNDIKRIGGMGGVNNKLIRETVGLLDFAAHEVLYLDKRTRKLYITKVN